MSNKFIVTGKGFVQNIKFNPLTLKHDVSFTNSLRDAKLFTGKGANQTISKYELDGFIYSPWSQDAITDMWEVVYRTDYSYFNNEHFSSGKSKWVAQRASMKSESDAKFLASNKARERDTLLTEEEAKELAIKKNKEIIDYLMA